MNKGKRNNPFTSLTKEELHQQIAKSEQDIAEGKVMDAHEAANRIRKKYGL